MGMVEAKQKKSFEELKRKRKHCGNKLERPELVEVERREKNERKF
jgi:hypothetical protein